MLLLADSLIRVYLSFRTLDNGAIVYFYATSEFAAYAFPCFGHGGPRVPFPDQTIPIYLVHRHYA